MIVVVLGGARSGKSEVAERRITALAGPDPVTYVATGLPVSGPAVEGGGSGVAGLPVSGPAVEGGGSGVAGRSVGGREGGRSGAGSMVSEADDGGAGGEGSVAGGPVGDGPDGGGSAVGGVDSGRPGDPAWDERIARHCDRRPPHWTTVDAGSDLPAQLIEIEGPVLLDSLGPWVAARMDGEPDVSALAVALVRRTGDTVVVSDEVGLSVHPPTAAGRRFVDLLGTVNRAVAEIADEAWLVVAGRVVALEQEPAWPLDGPR